MSNESRSNLILGVSFILFSLLLIFVWIPLDTDSGILEKVRRQVIIGDALAPTLAGVFLLIGGFILVVFERNAPDQSEIDLVNLGFVAMVVLLLAVSFLVMRYTGPALVALANLTRETPLEYRLLRDTAPWKYSGFFIGGTLMIAGLIGLIEGKVTFRTIVIGIVAVLAMIAIYDLPFDDLLLPPNGDV
ncbi:MAG: hypothetical protein GY789_03100 [Hyphomicrobiales bacterium]|nr:hypothetical protein [Hyphomicrobiales bacterium]MCP5001717.1 hypothetical protein [Hyphomicrobiales bacterium]